MLTSNPPFGFLGLLLSLLLLLVLPGIFGEFSGSVISILFSLLLVASLYLVATDKKHLLIGLLLAVPSLFTHWSFGLLPETTRLTLNAGLQIGFLSYVSMQIYFYLLEARKVESNVIYAALCLYLMLGIIWAFIYFLIEMNAPGSIAIKMDANSPANTPQNIMVEVIYFSFVTLTTLGYGDFTPVSRLAKSFVIIQALVGQIYIAIVIARLVAMQIADKLSD